MGGKKAQTIGYHYPWAWHFGWTRFADALLAVKAGGADAWEGRVTENTVLAIDKPDLWGGEKGQGGMVGDLEVLFGGPDQAPSSYLTSTFGAKQSGNRGLVSTIWKGGRFGAFLANPKPVSMKFERIHAGSAGWYPEKAAIVIDPGTVLIEDLAFSATSASVGPYAGITIDSGFTAADTIIVDKPAGLTYAAWSPWDTDVGHPEPWGNAFQVTDDSAVTTEYWQGEFYASQAAAEASRAGQYIVLSGSASYTFWINDEPPEDNRGGLSLRAYINSTLARNPAHMIYEALTHSEMAGEPSGLIDAASFTAAADQLYLERFGLCTTYDSSKETPWDYITRICTVIAAECTQSRLDGKYYLDLVRGGYDIESLPVIVEDDILEFKAAPTTIEVVNSVSVNWRDPIKHKDRTTSPVSALGRVQAAGEIVHQTKSYYEIPYELLALRAAKRDLDIASPMLQRHELVVRRKYRGLRPGQPFRLQLPSEGIIDEVLRLGSIRHGTHRDGRVRMVAVQDVFDLPDTVAVQPSPGDWIAPSRVPVAPPAQVAFEAPYVELAASLSTADLSVVADDAGYLLTAAALPSAGINYTIATAAASEDYVERGAADFCPTALIVEASALEDPLSTGFTLSGAAMLDRVEVGSWALWGDEIVRVDAIDPTALTCTLGRGCADTVPAVHDAGARIWFCGDWVGSDGREYVDADVVDAKLLTRTSSAQLALGDATAETVTFDQRMARPYPPAALLVGGLSYPSSISGSVLVAWNHRDRILQADQLLDTSMSSVGPRQVFHTQ